MSNRLPIGIALALLSVWCVGMFARGLWTPDEPREADIAWRMSWQADKVIPLLAGEPFCEKPPLLYWIAATPIARVGMLSSVARLPNLLYAILGTLSIALLAQRSLNRRAALVAAPALGSFLLSYQVAIWLATDAPLLAFDCLALLGLWSGFYADRAPQRWRGYTLMHLGLALGFLSKSAFAWVVPLLALMTLIVWERRWRELFAWQLYAGLVLQALLIGTWVWYVYAGPEGTAHLKVFFWNNLAGRLTSVAAPEQLQYAKGHRNSPGKYLLELPVYLWPWTLLMVAALRRAWQSRHMPTGETRALRFALASSLPALIVLSFAATARNVYLAPTLPGFALLLAWWSARGLRPWDRFDWRTIRASAVMLGIAAAVVGAALIFAAADAQPSASAGVGLGWILGAAGIAASVYLSTAAWRETDAPRALAMLFFAFCALLGAPCWILYEQVDRWQDLASLASSIKRDVHSRPLILLAPDETTRAFVDLYVDTRALSAADAATPRGIAELNRLTGSTDNIAVLVQLPGREYTATVTKITALLRHDHHENGAAPEPPWLSASGMKISQRYSLPNGRRYALLRKDPQRR